MSEMRQGALRSGWLYLHLDDDTYNRLAVLCKRDARDIRQEALFLLREAMAARERKKA